MSSSAFVVFCKGNNEMHIHFTIASSPGENELLFSPVFCSKIKALRAKIETTKNPPPQTPPWASPGA
jgi:hypothetical protein